MSEPIEPKPETESIEPLKEPIKATKAATNWVVDKSTWRGVHLTLAVVWTILIIPTMLWWSESILWVLLISIYANIASHWGAYQATRVEDAVLEAAESS